MKVRGFTRVALALMICMGAFAFPVSADEQQDKESPSTTCLVCGASHKTIDYVVEYKGAKYYLCSLEDLQTFRRLEKEGRMDTITFVLEPRSALFHEDSAAVCPLGSLSFCIGAYILLGLVCGATASYIALQKGRCASCNFALGFFLNIPGIAIAALLKSVEGPFSANGFKRIPTTRDELRCPGCDHSNHPSADKCSNCAGPLTPDAPSEVKLVSGSKDTRP